MFFRIFFNHLIDKSSHWKISSLPHWQIRKLSLSLPLDTERSIRYFL
ncbi:hypothetical protein HMPREF1551_01125 [Capnocytophaga sp. oral taxon 863 str. F0517]|nr:hypothetical protein HMPREF1551_01125 [Capnocytophaga sp. oral taxon 863 str. F0517]